jgi:hypothetical protein
MLAKGNTETRSSALPGMPALEPPVVARGAIPGTDDRNPSSYKPTQPVPPLPAPLPVPKLLPPERSDR